MNLQYELNMAELRTLQWIIKMYDNPNYTAEMIEHSIRMYTDNIQKMTNEMKPENTEI